MQIFQPIQAARFVFFSYPYGTGTHTCQPGIVTLWQRGQCIVYMSTKIMSLVYQEAYQALLPQCLLHVCSRGA